ncbi:MAG: aspartate carbamoyltransferase catalytic subunit [Chloroflexi bacterium]|nr:aspartate carbamoyltransferase catalytic subunit [Chloroflexota bacterium]
MTTRAPAETAPGTSVAPRRHVLDLDDFSAGEIHALLDSAEAMREVLGRSIKKVPSLRGKVVITLFLEPSTRTRVSFEQAGKMLSADVINIGGAGSAAEKGESLLNTALTLQAMHADLIVIRHPHSGAPYFLARNLTSTAVVNAGDGMHAHPTQALLDLMTMRRHLGSLEGAKVVIVGDVLHSRVARSNAFGLATSGASVVLCGPPTMMPLDLLHAGRTPSLPNVTVEPDLDAAIEGADVVMTLRLQSERQEAGMLPSLREYTRRWQVNEARMSLAKPGALLMHPGPMNEGVEIASSLAHGGLAQIEEQVTNGVALRMALLYQLLTGTEERP